MLFVRYCLFIVNLLIFLVLGLSSVHAQPGNGISSPTPNAVVSHTVEIRGVAFHPRFRKWQLDLLLDNKGHGTFLALGEEAAEIDTPLARWDTIKYPDGIHTLRLRVVHSDLNYDEYFLAITIRNNEPTKPVVKEQPLSTPVQQTVVSIPPQPSPPPDTRWIEIDLSAQRLFAWEDGIQVFQTTISTGRTEYPTVVGTFRIRTKLNSTRMRGPGYDTPDVPWTMYFYRSYAIHGAYWHNDFGVPVSHGCVNLPVNNAKQLFDWTEVGTKVIVHQ